MVDEELVTRKRYGLFRTEPGGKVLTFEPPETNATIEGLYPGLGYVDVLISWYDSAPKRDKAGMAAYQVIPQPGETVEVPAGGRLYEQDGKWYIEAPFFKAGA